MRFSVNGSQAFASTGGRDHQSGQPWIIFIHGAGQNRLTWSQQVRAFAYDDFNVLALDLPAHGKSRGEALEGADLMAAWVVQVMDELEIDRAHLVNHSMGGLVSLELGLIYPQRVKSIAFIATAMTIAVNDALIEMAKSEPGKAFEFMTSLGHGPFAHLHDNSVPGASLIGSGLQVMAQNQPDALPADLAACANYRGGANAAANISCPTLCLLAGQDQMVALKFGLKLSEALQDCETHVFEGAGHMLPGERPREVNHQLRLFYLNRF
ncbi:MAG: alpha/beta hydrolase [Rhizobiaceae bacterium]|nr:alpha/beta hydrolase [Rhizobiaceae bacterium]